VTREAYDRDYYSTMMHPIILENYVVRGVRQKSLNYWRTGILRDQYDI
jgi:hypothetical protein